jgi:hypothetical protein
MANILFRFSMFEALSRNTVFKLCLPDDAGVVLILCRADLLCLCRDRCGCAALLDWLSIIFAD